MISENAEEQVTRREVGIMSMVDDFGGEV